MRQDIEEEMDRSIQNVNNQLESRRQPGAGSSRLENLAS